MPLPSTIADLSTTAASNYPAGSDAPSVMDDVMRAHASFIATLRDTVITRDGVETLTNKTLTAPVISTISNTGTLTLPTSTDTIVGRATTDTLTNKTATNLILDGAVNEEIYAVSTTTPALDPANGTIQTWTLSGNSTPTAGAGFTAGRSMLLMIDDGTAYSVTWTSMPVVWLNTGNTAPGLATAGYTAVSLWKVGTTIYGKF
jgi:hypothetical protein